VTPPDATAPNPGQPPPEITPENAAAHLRWLTEETRRFQTFVDRQLGVLQKMRAQLNEFEAKARADLLGREQALNRERAVLDARAADVARRESELAAALTRQGEELTAELERLVAAEREQLSRRADELARGEEALQRRLAEAEETEQTMRAELEEREKAVEESRRLLAEAEAELRNRLPYKPGPAFFITTNQTPTQIPPPGGRPGK
jgi:hypothetical protein